MLNELIKMCKAYISEYVKSEGSTEFYYMGKVHALLNVIYMYVSESGYKDVERYTDINREWEEVFQEKNFK